LFFIIFITLKLIVFSSRCIVSNKQHASHILKKAQKQIAGFGGCWKYDENNDNSKSLIITAYFAIVQIKNDEIDEPLWMDLAKFDV
jgi:hypothetical protein